MLRPPSSTTERLEAFSDGVIAIAITLLVLEIGVPHVDAHDSLWNALVYSLTLVAIGIAFSGMWYHLMKRPWLLATGVPTERTHIAFKRSMIGPGLYLLTVGLAFVSAPACFVAYALISLYFAAGPSSRVVTPADPNELERGSP